MSVPMLMTVLDSNTAATAAPAATPSTLLLDEHIKSCASYVEAAAVISPKYATTTVSELEDIDDVEKIACTPALRPFTVQLSVELEPNELIGLTGESKTLGEWQLDRCITLNKQDALEWSANVLFQACRNSDYRYFVYVEDKQGRRQIRRWETRLKPRKLEACVTNCRQVDRFGEIIAGEPQVNRGWLTNDSIVQLKFEREKIFQVQDIEKFDPEHVLIKIVPLGEELHNTPGISIDVVKFKYGDSHLQPQPSQGVSYKRNDIVIFHVTVPHPLEGAFALQFYTPENKLMGKAIVHADALQDSEGVLELNITETESGANAKIAHLTLPYLHVQPFTDVALDFRTTYAHDWPKSWPNLDVGHRGNGRSYLANPPAEIENTVASFLRAYEVFADMIELDVHLTADGVPIIYHDFGVRTAPQNKTITSADQLEYVLLKDLTYEMIKQLRVFALVNEEVREYPSHNSESRPEHRIFPTLVDVLQSLPKTLGIDVEIKWPQRKACGGVESVQTIDKNYFINRVIATIIAHGCGRPLVFSSFDADICTMLRFKQNIFPVLFLTMGETKKWQPYTDLRTRNFEQAVNNAQAFELAGTAPHAEDFLGSNGAALMQKALQQGQVTLVWGDDCNSKERVKYFNEIGATATCYDRSDLYMPESKQRSFFNSSSLMAEFEAQCRA